MMQTKKAEAIVLSRRPYNDKWEIYTLYSSLNGRCGLLYPLGRKLKGNIPLSPLSLIEVELKGSSRSELYRMGECGLLYPLYRIGNDPIRSDIALFLGELFYEILFDGACDEVLYGWLKEVVLALEDYEGAGLANFHIYVLVHLSEQLGISPDWESYHEGLAPLFSPREGRFVSPKGQDELLDYQTSRELWALSQISLESLSQYRYSRAQRSYLLNTLISYYGLHMPNFGSLRSLPVLRQKSDMLAHLGSQAKK